MERENDTIKHETLNYTHLLTVCLDYSSIKGLNSVCLCCRSRRRHLRANVTSRILYVHVFLLAGRNDLCKLFNLRFSWCCMINKLLC